jgi:FkbM family methyltransferase
MMRTTNTKPSLRKALGKFLFGRVFMSESLAVQAWGTEIMRRLDRLQNDVDFVKNHASSYLGGGVGMTHLVDETPIYINTNDFGCPANFINGGRYEEEYYAVLASFRRPDSAFLDIGANLGVFSLRMAPLLRKGKVIAFEPNPLIRTLFSRSVHLNGLSGLVQVHELGASDKDEQLVLSVPDAHAGGASVVPVGSGTKGHVIEVRRLDGLLADLPRFDIAKIDVEGHELSALRGMTALLGRSPDAVLLFEKLGVRSGIEQDLMALFGGLGMRVYRVDGHRLVQVDLATFEESSAYFLATRPQTVEGALDRNFLDIYPDDLYGIAGRSTGDRLLVESKGGPGALMFHGPYWYLPRGTYSIEVDGDIEGTLTLTLAEKFGFTVSTFNVSQDTRQFQVVVHRDLTKFELVGRVAQDSSKASIRKIRMTRVG